MNKIYVLKDVSMTKIHTELVEILMESAPLFATVQALKTIHEVAVEKYNSMLQNHSGHP